MIFAASRSAFYMAYIAHVITGVWWSEVGICDARVCVLFVSSRSGIVFNPSASAITIHSQSAKDIDPYFKSQLCGGPMATESRHSFYRMGWVNPESESRNLISAMGGIRTHNLFINSPTCYHWAIVLSSLIVQNIWLIFGWKAWNLLYLWSQ